MKKINITILTNPLLFTTDRIGFLINNVYRSLLSLNKNNYEIDLKFLLWQPIYFSQFLDIISENSLNFNNFKNYSVLEDAFDIVHKSGTDNNKLSYILNKTLEKIKKNNDKLLFNFKEISFEIAKKNRLGISAHQAYRLLTDDIRNLHEYDMYFFISSNFIMPDDSITNWIFNYEKYPELPFYLNWPDWEQDNLFVTSPNEMRWVNNTHAFAVIPQKLITFLDKTLWDDDFIRYSNPDGVEGILQPGYEISNKLHLGLHWLSNNDESEIKINNCKIIETNPDNIFDSGCFSGRFPLFSVPEPG